MMHNVIAVHVLHSTAELNCVVSHLLHQENSNLHTTTIEFESKKKKKKGEIGLT